MNPNDNFRRAAGAIGDRIETGQPFRACTEVFNGTDDAGAICACGSGHDEVLCIDHMAEHLMAHDDRCPLCGEPHPLGLIDGTPIMVDLVIEHLEHSDLLRRHGLVSVVLPACAECVATVMA